MTTLVCIERVLRFSNAYKFRLSHHNNDLKALVSGTGTVYNLDGVLSLNFDDQIVIGQMHMFGQTTAYLLMKP